MFTFNDFLSGVLSEYLLTCEAHLYSINTQLIDADMVVQDLEAYEIPRLNGYLPRTFSFQSPVLNSIDTRQVFTTTANYVEWSAEDGPLGGSTFNYIGIIARANTTKSRLIYVSAVNPQPSSPGSTVIEAMPFTLQAGNTFRYTPEISITNELNP